jgi:hypothetical protein
LFFIVLYVSLENLDAGLCYSVVYYWSLCLSFENLVAGLYYSVVYV